MSVWSSSIYTLKSRVLSQLKLHQILQVVWLRFFGHSHFYAVQFLHYTRSDFLAAGSFLEVPFFWHSLALIFGTRSALWLLFFLHFLAPLFGPQSLLWSAILSYTFLVPILWATVSFMKCHFILHLLVPIFWAAVSFMKCHFVLHSLAPIFFCQSHFWKVPFCIWHRVVRNFWPTVISKRRHFYLTPFGSDFFGHGDFSRGAILYLIPFRLVFFRLHLFRNCTLEKSGECNPYTTQLQKNELKQWIQSFYFFHSVA